MSEQFKKINYMLGVPNNLEEHKKLLRRFSKMQISRDNSEEDSNSTVSTIVDDDDYVTLEQFYSDQDDLQKLVIEKVDTSITKAIEDLSELAAKKIEHLKSLTL